MGRIKVQRARSLPKGEARIAALEGRAPRYNWLVKADCLTYTVEFTYTGWWIAMRNADRLRTGGRVGWAGLVGVRRTPERLPR